MGRLLAALAGAAMVCALGWGTWRYFTHWEETDA
jgi:hypothetical protein